ncbi:MAG: hypothetical protein J6Q65_04735 [Lentisphaeria bacterium]|nr:hypothetical protein [Lentisphaeria bacterium]
MTSDVLLGLVPSIISLLGIVITAVITNSLVKYRVDQLEKKVDKHNNLIERMYVCETEIKDIKEHLK